MKVLIVDDEPGVRFTLASALEAPGFEAVEAASGPEALELVEDVDVVVTDLVMPGMDGLALLAAIRARDPELPVILLTAQGSERTAVQAMKAGAYDYLTKPFQVDQLREIVFRCLESKGLLRMTEEALRESLGSAIRERRKALGLTLSNMSDRTGVSLGYLSQIELGKNSASIETLYRICLALGMKMSELFQAVQRN